MPEETQKQMTSEQLAQIAYEAYLNTLFRLGVDVMEQWNQLELYERDAWIAAAQAVQANVLSGFTKVGEGEQP